MTTGILAFALILATANLALMIIALLKKHRNSASLAWTIAGIALIVSLLYFVGGSNFSAVIHLSICAMWSLNALMRHNSA